MQHQGIGGSFVFRRLLREPLLHFLAIGFGLFAVFGYISRDERSEPASHIVVDRDRLVTFMGYRSRGPQTGRAEDLLDSLSKGELQSLIAEYVREEALYREAKALSLDRSDYSLRRRLIRQLEFINQGLISPTIALSESDLLDYLEARKDRYYVPSKITFTHVFFNRDKHGDTQALALARRKLHALNESRVPFHAALSHGDRFLYHRNYVSKDADEIASHFGSTMQEKLFAGGADSQLWQGPFRSAYGYHLVMVTRLQAGYHPSLAEVHQRVAQDAMQSRLKAELDRVAQSIVDAYEVVVVTGIQQDTPSPGVAERVPK